jgi:predicted nucleic acid-binding protein
VRPASYRRGCYRRLPEFVRQVKQDRGSVVQITAARLEASVPLPPRVFCDTSYFCACADTDDMHYRTALTLAGEAARRRTQLWTTWDVISESVTLLRYRHRSAAAIRFLDNVKPGLHVMDYGANIRVEAEQVFRRHSRDHRLSFCDAVSSRSSPRCWTACPVSRSTKTSTGWA